jgi:hypothetical protein
MSYEEPTKEPVQNLESSVEPKRHRAVIVGAAALALVVTGWIGSEAWHGRESDAKRSTLNTRLLAQDARIRSLEKSAAARPFSNIAEVRAAAEAITTSTRLSNTVNATIDDPDKTAQLQRIDGIVHLNHPRSSSPQLSYKNPIFLASPRLENGTLPKPDLKGKFLKGSWIGVQMSRDDGEIEILPLPYDEDTMTFEANEGATQPYKMNDVRVFSVRDTAGHPTNRVYAVNPETAGLLRDKQGDYVLPGITVAEDQESHKNAIII